MWLNNIYAKLNSSGAGQQSPPLQFMTYRAALGVLQGPFFVRGKCCFSFIALHADHSGSTLFLQIVADSCSLSSLPSWVVGGCFLFVSFLSLSGKYYHG